MNAGDSTKLSSISKLTSMSHGGGCGCKIGPDQLAQILQWIPASADANVLIDARDFDDAAIYRLNDESAVVLTVDFFTPLVDNAYDFGKIAVTNAINDVYAKGGTPVLGLNLVAYPSRTHSIDVLGEILRGGLDQATSAGITIAGGHSIDDPEVKYGMVVMGLINPGRIISNGGAQLGDVLMLTKPLGTGVICTAIKFDVASVEDTLVATQWMTQLGKPVSEAMRRVGVNACTDVTGFGLIGHLHEMITASGVGAKIDSQSVPVIENVRALIHQGMSPSGALRNLEYLLPFTDTGRLSEEEMLLLCDPQSAGGFLISMPRDSAGEMQQLLKGSGALGTIIGEIVASPGPRNVLIR